MRLRLASLCVAAATALGCGAAPPPAPAAPPAAEFLVTAGDSTFWVRAEADGVHVRGAPITITRLGGRFYELYTADAGVDYDDASFGWERLYERDLLTGDSLLVFDDSAAARAAHRWAAAHPRAEPLDEEDDAPADPPLAVTGEVDLLGVHGPYASLEHRFTRDEARGDGEADVRRAVVDLRTGRPASLVALFGDAAAAALEADGRRAYAVAADSVRRATGAAARRARAALGDFAFDPASFALRDQRGVPVVAFVAPGGGPEGGYALPLPPVRAPEPAWWRDARAALPAPSPDSTADVWAGPRYRVVATYDTAGAVTLALRDTAGREWPAVHTSEPAERLYRLDAPPLADAARRALARAFDESALYPDDARAVRWAPRERARHRARRRAA